MKSLFNNRTGSVPVLPRFAAVALLLAGSTAFAQSLPGAGSGAASVADNGSSTEASQSADNASGDSSQQADNSQSQASKQDSQSNSSASSSSASGSAKKSSSSSNGSSTQKKSAAPKAGNWKVPDITGTPAPLNQTLAATSFSDSVRNAAQKLDGQQSDHADLAAIKGKPALSEGDSGEQVSLLVDHLKAWGYLKDDSDSADSGPHDFYYNTVRTRKVSFDARVKSAVQDFQRDHGLVADGVVGPQVATALNVVPNHQAAALRVWAKAIDQQVRGARAHGAAYLALVNVPSYTLHLIRTSDGKQVLESRVIVGTSTHMTPLFWTRIVSLKYSPDWVAPVSIAKGKYKRTPPGPSNPLGLLRFSTNNDQAIFLHDTDNHTLFNSAWRARSHGCIRVQQWVGLAETIGPVTPNQLQAQLEKRRTLYGPVHRTTLVRSIDSVVDVVDGKPTVWPDPYNLGNNAIGAKSLQGMHEGDPSALFSTAPGKPLMAGDTKKKVQGAP